MEGEFYLSEITPATSGWKARVLIEEKSNVFETGNGHRHMKLVLSDEQGNKVQGILWDKELDTLKDVFRPFKTFYIRGAFVQNINPLYLPNANGLTVQRVIRRSNLIELVTEKDKEIPYPHITVTSFHHLPSCLHDQTTVDMLAVVTDVRPPKNKETKFARTQLQEITVVHHDLKPMLLTLWSDFVSNQGVKITASRNDMPIVLCKRLKVTNYQVLSLATTPLSYVEVNPNIQQARELRNWANDNVDLIRSVMDDDESQNYNPALLYNPKEEIVPVAYLEANGKTSWVKAFFKLNNLEQECCFMTCSECDYKTSVLTDEQFSCNMCGVTQTPSPRCKLVVELKDDSGSIEAVMYDRNVENLVYRTPMEISLMQTEARKSMLVSAEENIKSTEILAHIRTMKKKYGGGTTQHTVHTWFPSRSVDKSPKKLRLPTSQCLTISKHGESSNTTKQLTETSQDDINGDTNAENGNHTNDGVANANDGAVSPCKKLKTKAKSKAKYA